MRAREFTREDVDPSAPASATTTAATNDPNASSDQKVQQLTTAISGLQKQIQTLQKNALQTDATAPAAQPAAAPPPGQGSQQQQAKGTVGTGTGNGTLAQQQQPPAPGQQPGLGQPNGVPMGQPPAGQQPQKPPLGVSQPPAMVQNKIRTDLQHQMNK